jgi:hypothetical protein
LVEPGVSRRNIATLFVAKVNYEDEDDLLDFILGYGMNEPGNLADDLDSVGSREENESQTD